VQLPGIFTSLRIRLLLLVLLALSPAFGLIVHSDLEAKAKAALAAEQQTRQLAARVAAEQARLFAQTRQLLITLADLPLIRDADMLPRCQSTLERIRQRTPQFADIGIVDNQGNLLCSAIPFTTPINFADRSWFRRARDSRGFATGDYLVGRLTGLPSIGLAYSHLDGHGEVDKVIYATIDLA
jgi:hypothetical protein